MAKGEMEEPLLDYTENPSQKRSTIGLLNKTADCILKKFQRMTSTTETMCFPLLKKSRKDSYEKFMVF